MQLVTRSLSDYSTHPVSWLWTGRVPRGKVTMLAGDPGLGKSFLTMDLAARVTVNADMPDSKTNNRTTGTVLVLSAEDDAGDTIRPRIEAAGGNPKRVEIVEGIRRRRGDEAQEEDGSLGVRLDLNMPAIEKKLATMERPRLVIIDPISAYLGDVDGHSNSQVRGLLGDLARVAMKYGPAVLCVTHLNKSGGGKAVYRMMGSLAFTAAARIVWLVSKHPDEPDKRVLVLMKTNLDATRTGLAFGLKDGRVEWDPTPLSMDADSLESGTPLPQDHRQGAQPGRVDDATACIEGLLITGVSNATDVIAAARARGFSHMAIRRAKQRLGVLSVREIMGVDGRCHWKWRLPAGGPFAAELPDAAA